MSSPQWDLNLCVHLSLQLRRTQPETPLWGGHSAVSSNIFTDKY